MTTSGYEVAAEINRLRKSGNWREALRLGEQEILNFPGNLQINSALAWAIYDETKNTDKGNLNPRHICEFTKHIWGNFSLLNDIAESDICVTRS